jgi:preprotein translocase subunit SecB
MKPWAKMVIKTVPSTKSNKLPDLETEVKIQKLYLKKVCSKVLQPQLFLRQPAINTPELKIQLDVSIRCVAQHIHEVNVTAVIHATVSGENFFELTVTQAGVFSAQGVSEELLPAILNVRLAHLLFATLRAQVTDLGLRSGLSALYLSEFDFHVFYKNRLALIKVPVPLIDVGANFFVDKINQAMQPLRVKLQIQEEVEAPEMQKARKGRPLKVSRKKTTK